MKFIKLGVKIYLESNYRQAIWIFWQAMESYPPVNTMLFNAQKYVRAFLESYISDSGGDIEIVVASDKDAKVAPVREAFQNVFGNATVKYVFHIINTVNWYQYFWKT